MELQTTTPPAPAQDAADKLDDILKAAQALEEKLKEAGERIAELLEEE